MNSVSTPSSLTLRAGLSLARILSWPPKLHPRPRICALYWCMEYGDRHPGETPTAGEVEAGLWNEYRKEISRTTAWRGIQDWKASKDAVGQAAKPKKT